MSQPGRDRRRADREADGSIAPAGSGKAPLLSVAVVVDVGESFYREVASGVAQYGREVGDWQLFVSERFTELSPNLRTWNGQGIITPVRDDRSAAQLARSGLPVVAVGCLGCRELPPGLPHVETDNRQIAALAFDHLRSRGFTNFAYYGRKPLPSKRFAQVRGDAFEACVTAAGFRFDRLVARHDPAEWRAVRRELVRWLQAVPKPIGLLLCADSHGRNVMEACRTLGLRVPHDVAVVGVDNDELDCELAMPSLTSVQQSARRIGHEAARLLDRLMRPDRFGTAGRKTTVPPLTMIPPQGIVTRGSTDTFAAADPAIARVIVSLRESVGRRLTVADLARIAGLSTWRLKRRFRASVGHSIRDEILRIRLAEAERLVGTTDLPLKAVARRSGFCSVTYLTTMFRRRFGDPPGRYRRLRRSRAR